MGDGKDKDDDKEKDTDGKDKDEDKDKDAEGKDKDTEDNVPQRDLSDIEKTTKTADGQKKNAVNLRRQFEAAQKKNDKDADDKDKDTDDKKKDTEGKDKDDDK